MTDAFRHDDPYQVLGLTHGASPAEITRAYRLRARTWHPDVRPGDPDAAAQFRALSDAYATLTDPARRAEYERAEYERAEYERARFERPRFEPPRFGSVTHQRAPAPTTLGGDPPLWAGPVWIEPDPLDQGPAW